MHAIADLYGMQARFPERYGEHWSGPAEMVERVARFLGTSPHHRVLDLGCGVGGPARRLARITGAEVVGIDLLPDVVAAAGRRAREDGARRCRFVGSDAALLPFPDGTFDQAWSLGMVAHATDVDALAAELARVLRPGARACFTEAFWDGRRRPRFAGSAPDPWRALTAAALASALLSAGFEAPVVLPWPGGRVAEADVGHADLRADLLDRRLRSAMVVAGKP